MKTVTERGPARRGASSKACPVADNDPIDIKILIWVVWMFSRKMQIFLGVGDPGGSPLGTPQFRGSLENLTKSWGIFKSVPRS